MEIALEDKMTTKKFLEWVKNGLLLYVHVNNSTNDSYFLKFFDLYSSDQFSN